MQHTINLGNGLQWSDIYSILNHDLHYKLHPEAVEKIKKAHNYLTEKISQGKKPIYGINTGFGSLCNVAIPNHQLTQLQINLVRSHACGAGKTVPLEIVKLMLVLKIESLSKGHSGVQLITVERMIDMLNKQVYPEVYELGSLGASGDLAPLAHLSMPLFGEGFVYYQGERVAASQLEKLFGWKPITLQAKEGLALLNGTQYMSALNCYAIIESFKIWEAAHATAALSFEGFDCTLEPFNPLIHNIRPHKGQKLSAERMRKYLMESKLANNAKNQVQDPYSFRCIPQVHGASWQVISHVSDVLHTEINAVTDNPNIFIEEDIVLSGGNFHGQPLALAADYLALSLAELGSISERRTYLLISGQRNLPAFLTPEPGLNSGFMIPQYTAAAIVSQNKQLCSPASIDSIVSSNGQEDHVSMGANAATRLLKIVDNLWQILGIEWATAAQALQFRNPQKTSPPLLKLYNNYTLHVPFQKTDCFMQPILNHAKSFLQQSFKQVHFLH